jgi:hypothetical protein
MPSSLALASTSLLSIPSFFAKSYMRTGIVFFLPIRPLAFHDATAQLSQWPGIPNQFIRLQEAPSA